jgi:hypothetical protein
MYRLDASNAGELFIAIESATVDCERLFDVYDIALSPSFKSPTVQSKALETITEIYANVGMEGSFLNIAGMVAAVVSAIKKILAAIYAAWRYIMDWIFDSWNKAKLAVYNYGNTLKELTIKVSKGFDGPPRIKSATEDVSHNGSGLPVIYNEKIYDHFYCYDTPFVTGVFNTVTYLLDSINTTISTMDIFVDNYSKLLNRANEMKRLVDAGQSVDQTKFHANSMEMIIKSIGVSMNKYRNKNSNSSVTQYGPIGSINVVI